jgi:hypothetical protein
MTTEIDTGEMAKKVLAAAQALSDQALAAGLAITPAHLLTLAIRQDILDRWNAFRASERGREVCELAIELCRKEQCVLPADHPKEEIVRGQLYPLAVCTVHGPSREGYPKNFESALRQIHEGQPLWACYIGQATAVLDERRAAGIPRSTCESPATQSTGSPSPISRPS